MVSSRLVGIARLQAGGYRRLGGPTRDRNILNLVGVNVLLTAKLVLYRLQTTEKYGIICNSTGNADP
jgi:hypothetical protein